MPTRTIRVGLRCFCLALSLVLLLSAGAWAQGTSTVSGMMTDQTGAVLAKVPVKLVNVATGATYNSETNAAGLYRFGDLPVGTYNLTAQVKGFRNYKVNGLVTSVGAVLTHDIKMLVGSTAESVEVNAAIQTVQTTESQISQLIDQRVWTQMPNATRDSNSFLNLVAGAVPDSQAGSTRGASINGARGGTGNFLVEGIDNNDQGQGGRGQLGDTDGGAVTSISPDAIQEYRVITNGFSAEYGKAGGFVTDTVLKSGTNKFHGSLFEYNRVQALAANNFFSNRSEDPSNPGHKLQDRLVRNQFGGSIGGPIVKDKTFFFASTEIHRRRTTTPLTATATTPEFMNWVSTGGMQRWAESDPNGICNNQAFWDSNFTSENADGSITYLPGYRVAAPCAGAFAGSANTGNLFKAMSAKSPFPLGRTGGPCGPVGSNDNCVGQGYYTTGLYYPVPLYSNLVMQLPAFLNEYRISGKFDHKISEKDQFSFLYLLQDAESGDPYNGGGSTVGPAYINQGRSQNFGATWNHSFSPTFLNTFRASFLRHVSNFPETAPGMPEVYTWNDALSVGLGMYSGLPQYFTDNQFQFQDHMSLVRGKHSFKYGGEYRRTRNGSSFFNGNKGSFYPWSVEDLVTDMMFTDEIERFALGGPVAGSGLASASVDLTTGGQPDVYRGFRANEMAMYFQDDWRINSRLSINVGLRYEYFGPPHNYKPDIDSNFYFGASGLPIGNTFTNANGTFTNTNQFFPKNNPFYQKVATGTFQIRNNEIWNKDTNNFGPRFGLSWDMLGTQKLVFRMGGGIMYDRVFNNIFENMRFNPPHFSNNQIGASYNGIPVGALATPGLFTYPFTSTAMFGDARYAAVPNPRHMDQNMVSPYYEQGHVGFQWEFARGYVFEPYYIGTFGHKLMAYRDINTFNGRTAFGTRCRTAWSNPGAANSDFAACRPNQNVGADNYRSNDYSSNYHGLQLTVRKNYGHGLQFNSSYTYSKALDTISDVFNGRNGATVTDTENIKADYGPADFDMRHRWVTTLSYDMPFMKGNRFLGGWTVNTIISLQTGIHFSPYSSSSSYDLNKNGLSNDRVIPKSGSAMGTTNNITPIAAGWDTGVAYFNPQGWTRATCASSVNGGRWCDAPIGRNSMVGPGYQNVDLGISKTFKVTEGTKLQFQANMFNAFNHTNFGLPTFNQTSSYFGQIRSAYGARQTQLALRFDW